MPNEPRRPSLSPSPSYGQRSLWDLMLKKAALEFGRALADLRLMEIMCGNSINYPLSVRLKMISFDLKLLRAVA
jgi:hypothetical protein